MSTPAARYATALTAKSAAELTGVTAKSWADLTRINMAPRTNSGAPTAVPPATRAVLAVAALTDAAEQVTALAVARLTGLTLGQSGATLQRLVESHWITRHGMPRGQYRIS